MSRNDHRSRSRSFSKYRYNTSSKNKISRSRSPSFTKYRDEAPPPARRYERSRSGSRNGNRNGSERGGRLAKTEKSKAEPSNVIGVFGLHVRTSEDEVRDIFDRFGSIQKVHMVMDQKFKSFRGYCFIYYKREKEATAALNECNGLEIKDRRIRVDYSFSQRAHSPTPGYYKGKRTSSRSNNDGGGSGGGGGGMRRPLRDERRFRDDRPRSREREVRRRSRDRDIRPRSRERDFRRRSRERVDIRRSRDREVRRNRRGSS